MDPRKVLLTGWFSFLHGEATAGDVLALQRVEDVLSRAGMPYDIAWSPGFRPGELHLEEADPGAYTHLIFVCGPLHGPQVQQLHHRFADCFRIAIGISVVDENDPAVTGFHRVLPRDGYGDHDPVADLAAHAPAGPPTPVVGVILTHGQHEYGERRRHGEVAEAVTGWLGSKDCARLEWDTRLDTADWRLCATPAQFQSVVERLDLVVTDRLHGLVLALRSGVPALAVDPVEGGAKLTAQARACRWPAVLPAGQLEAAELDRWWAWCLAEGRALSRQRRDEFAAGSSGDRTGELVAALSATPRISPPQRLAL